PPYLHSFPTRRSSDLFGLRPSDFFRPSAFAFRISRPHDFLPHHHRRHPHGGHPRPDGPYRRAYLGPGHSDTLLPRKMRAAQFMPDRKSTRLISSHLVI